MTKLEEKTRILNMVQDGKLSAQDAIQLLEALEASSNEQSDEKYELLPIQSDGRKARWLKILVTDMNGKKKVNLKVPLALVRWGLRMGGKVNFGNNSLKDLLSFPFLPKTVISTRRIEKFRALRGCKNQLK